MDFSLSEEQLALQEAARRLFSDRVPLDGLGATADAADPVDAVDAKLWADVLRLGFVGLAEQGGDFTLDAVLLEEAGYALAPVPLLSSAVAAPALTADTGADGPVASTVAWAEPAGPDGAGADAFGPVEQVRVRAVVSDGVARLAGRKEDVPDLQLAERLVVLAGTDAGPSAWVVRLPSAPDAVRAEYQPTLDGTRRVAQVDLVDVPAVPAPDGAVVAIRRRALAGLALESVGLAQRALELTVAHASTREQFGRPIGSYQAVSHRIADVYVAVELARSLAYRAAFWVAAAEAGSDAAEVDVACAAAKAAGGEAAVQACETLVQVLGGMGMTWEHPAHRLYKRALANRSYGGGPAAHRATIAAALLD
jgi:acyl-CoA dehydrogenase